MRKNVAIAVVVIAGAWTAVCATRKPSNVRNWAADQAVLPRASVTGPIVAVENVRNFHYRSETDYDVRYENRTYDLRKLDSVWYGVERFGGRGIAHTFLSFGFGDDFLAVSSEIRKEKDETYSPLRGLLNEYELMYVLGDERDIIGLRTNFRRDPVWLYRVNAKPDAIQRVFLDVIGRVNGLAAKPEFYNTLTNNCTTSIVRHVNRVAPKRVPFSMAIVLPGYSDQLAYELNLIGDSRPFAQLQSASRIDLIAQKNGITADFSKKIREAGVSAPSRGPSAESNRRE